MKFSRIVLTMSVVLSTLWAAVGYGADDKAAKFKLKPGAEGKLCLGCHPNLEDTLKKPFIHTPLKNAQCTGCHSAHSSNHGKMLAAAGGTICLSCHGSVVPKEARSVHKVVADGACMKCHDPHASAHKFNLVKSEEVLCADCHKGLTDQIAKVKFPHRPVEKGCVTCHLPHASAAAASLLRADIVALCTECHKTDRPIFAKQHMNYPVANVRCTSCHNPHGSDRPGILYNNVHKPVATRMCNQCHEDAAAADPLKLKKEGAELCKTCHAIMVNQMLDKNRVHWPALTKDGCLTCHNPHAASQKGLLRAPMKNLCGQCHKDTLKRQEMSLTKHEPVQEGACNACHDLHASNNNLLMKNPSTNELCGACHDWQKHSSHPIGEKVRDKRNKNRSLDCLSCHRSHGTEYKSFIPFSTISDLCVQCHAELKR